MDRKLRESSPGSNIERLRASDGVQSKTQPPERPNSAAADILERLGQLNGLPERPRLAFRGVGPSAGGGRLTSAVVTAS